VRWRDSNHGACHTHERARQPGSKHDNRQTSLRGSTVFEFVAAGATLYHPVSLVLSCTGGDSAWCLSVTPCIFLYSFTRLAARLRISILGKDHGLVDAKHTPCYSMTK